jgi:hypothetical protein
MLALCAFGESSCERHGDRRCVTSKLAESGRVEVFDGWTLLIGCNVGR